MFLLLGIGSLIIGAPLWVTIILFGLSLVGRD
jgi:hypothetical protein